MKRLTVWLLVLMMMFSSLPMVSAQEQVQLKVDGNIYAGETSPVMENGVWLVPVRAVSESLYATLAWNGETKTVVVSKEEAELSFTVGQSVAVINGDSVTLSTAPVIRNGTLYVPLNELASGLNATVTKDASGQTITVESEEYRNAPAFILETGKKMMDIESVDYTSSFSLESGGMFFKGSIFGTYQNNQTLSVHFRSAFIKGDWILTDENIYYRTGDEEKYRVEPLTEEIPLVSQPVQNMETLKALIENVKMEPYQDSAGEAGKKISFDINKDQLIEFIVQNFVPEEDQEQARAELEEMVQSYPEYKKLFETLNIHVQLLVDHDGHVEDHAIIVTFDYDNSGYGEMMEVKSTFHFTYSNFNQAEPIQIPSEGDIYDRFKEYLSYSLGRVRNAVLTYHFMTGEYPTRNGKPDGIVDFTKLIAFEEEYASKEDGFAEIYEKYQEEYGEEEAPFYIEFVYSVPESSYYIKESTRNLEASDRTVIYYVDQNGEVGVRLEKKPGSGTFERDLTYLEDLVQ
ncbi:MAG: copper amine oxidase N-terminal domain-containing protein [Bacillaceae bacterium]|nr:copper amine oxidase N-terminal domain-containing protein [Bacillaceae bacterium]